MKTATLVLCALMLGACASITRDIEVDSFTAPAVDLGAYSSYGWLDSAAIIHDPRGRWEPPDFDADAEIRLLINRELGARGFSETDAQPELLVAYAAGIDMTLVRSEYDPDYEFNIMRDVPQGSLAVVLIDRATRRSVWVGVAAADIQQDPAPETVRKRLEYAVTSMMRSLPD